MKQLAQQIRNELRIARRNQRAAEHNLTQAPSRLSAGYYNARSIALRDRRRVLGHLYLTLRKAMP